MLKKKDIPIIILLFAILTAAILFWAFYRETFKIGKTAALIDNSSKTIIINLENNSGTKQIVSFNFSFNNENIYIKPESYGSKKIINSSEEKLINGTSYDFKDFIFQGKIIKKTGSRKIEYDLLVTTGNLPIIKIDTTDQNGNIQGIPGNEADSARLDGKLNIFSSDSSLNQSNVGIEINTLGNTSNYEKFAYSFNIKERTIKNFTPKILDFEDSTSFKLNPLNPDRSLMRIKLSYDIFNMLGDKDHLDIAPKSEYVEVFVDNDYRGVYLLEERVNKKLFNLPKYNKKDPKHSVIYEAEEASTNFNNGTQGFTQKEPDPKRDKPYMDPLSEFVDLIKNASEETFNEQIGNMLDLNNAIDNQILFLLACNQDKAALNQYIYKSNAANSSQKFLFCPGDYYESSFGIDNNAMRLESFKSFTGNVLFERLYENPSYQQNFKARWNNLKKEMLTPENISKIIDKNFRELEDAQERNFKEPQNISFDSEIKYMKEFINDRILWLDNQINDPPVLKIGSTKAKIYEDYNTIFCSLPLGSDPLQAIEYDFKPGSKVYIETKSYGLNNIYSEKPDYSEFYGHEERINQAGKTDQMLIFVDKPESGSKLEGKIQVTGWAINPDVRNKVDIESIFIFDGPVVGKETFLGKAQTAIPRQDVSDYLKNPFYKNSGFELEINTFNLVNGNHEFYVYAFNKNGEYSVFILPLEIYNKNNIPGRILVQNEQKIDFKDFIFHGSMIIEDGNTNKEYDLWVTTGNLPLISISTNISDLNINEKIEGNIKIIDNSEFFEGNIGIKLRGWTSNIYSKKHYTVEIMDDYGNPKNVSLLGLPEENDWILHGPLIDKTLIRNAVAFKLSNEIGLYAPGNIFTELFLADINNSGNYRGVYSLTERIKVDKNRVDITKVSDTDKNNSNINNGFILEITAADKIRTGDLTITTYNGTMLEIEYPSKSEINNEQKKWVTDYLNEFLRLLYSDTFNDPIKGYYKYVDMDSLVDYVLINELFKNYDIFDYSTVITIDVDGKIKFGPVWDFDFSTGNILTEPKYNQPKGWTYINRQWSEIFFTDDNFMNKFSARWKELRKSVLSDDNIEDIIEIYIKELSDAQARNFNRWNVWDRITIGETDPYTEEIDKIRLWLKDRTAWLDENMK